MQLTKLVISLTGRLLPHRPMILPILSGPLWGRKFCGQAAIRPHYYIGKYEQEVTRLIQKHLKTGQVAYDIGANVGYLSLVMGTCVGPTGSVHAFEPGPDTFRSLMTNTHLNLKLPVRAYQMAIADQVGVEAFSFFDYDLVSHLGDTSDVHTDAHLTCVPVETVDNLVKTFKLPPPDFLKIDVEGAEARVIRGMAHVLRTYRPTLLMEIHSPELEEEVKMLLAQAAYRCERISDAMPVHLLCTPQVHTSGLPDLESRTEYNEPVALLSR